jgi:glycogen(starch) synthase
MKHLIVCPEYPPAEYAGGIGTYVHQISRMLAAAGETVHVVASRWKGARSKKERPHERLTIHRVGELQKAWPAISPLDTGTKELRGLKESSFPPQCFSFQAALEAEKLIEREGIDIVEGQEFEAPLYYLQLRRALGLGPKRQPPCIVHLHSPMEFIVRHNDWEIHHPYFRTAKRLEDYSIGAADAWLCPSQYLARQAESHYGLPAGDVRVISLPINAASFMERAPEIWETGTILYVGRLERRKGVMEWIRAAVLAAAEDPRLDFEFIGANCLGTDDLRGPAIVAAMVPDHLKGRFHFRGELNRSQLPRLFSRARMAVVPSRWENFPNTCVEAMCTGLPVIATKEGGMAEMIENGRTGWLADSADTDGLYKALRQALQVSPRDLSEMGREASATIRKKCDNERILENHLAFRRKVSQKGVLRSDGLAGKAPDGKKPHRLEAYEGRVSRHGEPNGIALVITCNHADDRLEECLDSISHQTRAPAAVLILNKGSDDPQTGQVLASKRKDGWQVLSNPMGLDTPLKNQGIRHILDSGIHPAGFSFLDTGVKLVPDFVRTCAAILENCPEVGLISGWIDFSGVQNESGLDRVPAFHTNGPLTKSPPSPWFEPRP